MHKHTMQILHIFTLFVICWHTDSKFSRICKGGSNGRIKKAKYNGT